MNRYPASTKPPPLHLSQIPAQSPRLPVAWLRGQREKFGSAFVPLKLGALRFLDTSAQHLGLQNRCAAVLRRNTLSRVPALRSKLPMFAAKSRGAKSVSSARLPRQEPQVPNTNLQMISEKLIHLICPCCCFLAERLNVHLRAHHPPRTFHLWASHLMETVMHTGCARSLHASNCCSSLWSSSSRLHPVVGLH